MDDTHSRDANFRISNIFMCNCLKVLVVQRGAKETRENWRQVRSDKYQVDEVAFRLFDIKAFLKRFFCQFEEI